MVPEYFWLHGMWVFPILMPVVMLIVLLIMVFLIFGRGGVRAPWQGRESYCEGRRRSESALDILKKRYARGEITKEEFEQMKKEIVS
jgi:putative membrane protein